MRDALLILFSLLVGHILFLSLTLLINHRRSGNFTLGLILLLFAVRVGKSVLALAFPAESLWLSTAGLVAMAALGPMLYQYSRQLFALTQEPDKTFLLHLLPALLCCFAWSWPLVNTAYYVITLHLLVYLLITAHHLHRHRESYRADNIRWKWSVVVMVASGVIWITFLAQVLVYVPWLYLIVVGTSVVLVYTLSLWASRQNNLFTGPVKKKGEGSADVYSELGRKVKKLMEEEEAFIDPALTLSALANTLGVPAYVLSKCINSFFQKSFPELLTAYRIEKSKQLLLSSLNKTYSIEGIAYESGFSTLSAFYHAFKKINGVTPAQFRKGAQGKNMHVA
jgi:AraC-like DNA-binding protein